MTAAELSASHLLRIAPPGDTVGVVKVITAEAVAPSWFLVSPAEGGGLTVSAITPPGARVTGLPPRGEALAWSEALLRDPAVDAVDFFLLHPESSGFLAALDAGRHGNLRIHQAREQIYALQAVALGASAHRGRDNPRTVAVFLSAKWPQVEWFDPAIAGRTGYSPAAGLGARRGFPSLFKANAIRHSTDPGHGWIEKIYASETGFAAETAWSSLDAGSRVSCVHFRPVEFIAVAPGGADFAPAIRYRQVAGMPATDLLFQLQRIGRRSPELVAKLEVFAGTILWQAWQALQEFRDLGQRWLRRLMRPYPWPEQIRQALLETRDLLALDRAEFEACVQQAEAVGERLVTAACQPFRDAHLKNRLIANPMLEAGYDRFCDWIAGAGDDAIEEWLKLSTYDIDFETGLWLVSDWDDPLHIFWSSNIGIDQVAELERGPSPYKPWPQPRGAEAGTTFWATLLCRSLRELCRRVWYANVMPRTYRDRYGIERRDHFLRLALAAASHLDGADALRRLLERCGSRGDELWRGAPASGSDEPVVARVTDRAAPGS